MYSLWIKKLNEIDNKEANRDKIRLLYYNCPLAQINDIEQHFLEKYATPIDELKKSAARILPIPLLEDIFDAVNESIDTNVARTLPGFAVLFVRNSINNGLTPSEITQEIGKLDIDSALNYIEQRYTAKPKHDSIYKGVGQDISNSSIGR